MSVLDKHQTWSTSACFCHNSQAQSKYAVINLIHTWYEETFVSFIACDICIRHLVSSKVIRYYQQNTITRVTNELTLRSGESTIDDAYACNSTAEGVQSAIVQK